MLDRIILGGTANSRIHYRFLARGKNIYETIFYAREGDSGERFRSYGDGFHITSKGISYRGIGGGFCSYMFGIDRPYNDLVRSDVRNRLTLFGARHRFGGLQFNAGVAGEEKFDKLFSDGNALSNYYFIVASPDKTGDVPGRQRTILKKLGRAIKHSPLAETEQDEALLDMIYDELAEPESVVMLIRLVDTIVHQYWNIASQESSAWDSVNEQTELLSMIGEDSMERINTEIKLRRQENRDIFKEFLSTVAGSSRNPDGREAAAAKVHRLRLTLARNGIPQTALDSIENAVAEPSSPEPESELQANIFEAVTSNKIPAQALLVLISSRTKARQVHDPSFDHAFNEAVAAAREMSVGERSTIDSAEIRLREIFSVCEDAKSILSKSAFFPESLLVQKDISTIIHAYRLLEENESGLFSKAMLSDLLCDPYITGFARKRLLFIEGQLPDITDDEQTQIPLLFALKSMMQDEVVFYRSIRLIKRDFWEVFSLWGERDIDMDFYTTKIVDRLKDESGEEIYISRQLWQEIISLIKKEVLFITQVMPQIVAGKVGAVSLREDFIKSCGLDRFYLEEVEKAYLEKHSVR